MPTHSGIKDNGTHFQIVPNTRKVAVPQSHKTIGTVGDHLSEQVTFICPKLIDGHDIKGCSEHYVSWETPSGEPGHDHLELIGEDAKNLLYAWNIRGDATIEAGIVSFSIHFADISNSGKTLYHWGTTDCKECDILTAVNHAIGVYERIYVDGNKLVIADFNLVKDRKLLLQTPGVVPDGNMFIDSNGHFDVAGLASVDVAVPTERLPIIEVSESGLITAHDDLGGNVTEHTLSVLDDPDFIPENIKLGKTIFGVTGTWGIESTTVTIENKSSAYYVIAEYFYVEGGHLNWKRATIEKSGTSTITIARGSELMLHSTGTIYPNIVGVTAGEIHLYKMYTESGSESKYIRMPVNKESVKIQCTIA